MAARERRHYRGLYAYTWDVGEVPEQQLVDELQRLSLNTLTLAASYHAGKFLRPHGKGGKVIFPEDGHANCQVRPERYGKIRPKQNSTVALDDVFGRFAARSDIGVNAWTVLLHNTFMGMQHPDAVARNAFGDPYWYSLCPANPDVRAYAVALCADIADRYPIASLTLETPGWLPYRHNFHHEFTLLNLDPATELSLGWCFCPHCMKGAKQAGTDAEGLRGRLAARITASLAAGFDAPAPVAKAWSDADLVLDAELSAFLRWRNQTVTSLVAEIRAAVRPEVALYVIPSARQPNGNCWIEGSDITALAGVADGIEVCLYGSSWQSVLADLAEVRSRAGDATVRCVLRPSPPDYNEEGGFRTTVNALRGIGQDDLAFYNYGHVRAANLEWIGRALSASRNGAER